MFSDTFLVTKMDCALISLLNSWNDRGRSFAPVVIWVRLLGMSLKMDFGLLYERHNGSHQRGGREWQGQEECVCEMTLFYSLQHLSTHWARIKTWDFPSSRAPRSLQACSQRGIQRYIQVHNWSPSFIIPWQQFPIFTMSTILFSSVYDTVIYCFS